MCGSGMSSCPVSLRGHEGLPHGCGKGLQERQVGLHGCDFDLHGCRQPLQRCKNDLHGCQRPPHGCQSGLHATSRPTRNFQTKDRDARENPLACRRFPEKRPGDIRAFPYNMITVVGEMFACLDHWLLAHHPIAFHHRRLPGILNYHPLPPPDRDRLRRIVENGDEIYERMRPIRRRIETWHIDHIIDFDSQAFEFRDVFGHGERIERPSQRIKKQ